MPRGIQFFPLLLLPLLACPARPEPQPQQPVSGAVGKVFDTIYEQGLWARNSRGEGTSGFGSTLVVTADYRTYLEAFIKNNHVGSVVDAGCGDWEFSSALDWGGATYLGVDVSEIVIDRVRQKYESPTVKFRLGDVSEALPSADLLIVKDVLQHLPNASIERFIAHNVRSGTYKWILLTNDRWREGSNNRDIRAGEHRGLDLKLPPFSLTSLEDVVRFKEQPFKVTQLWTKR